MGAVANGRTRGDGPARDVAYIGRAELNLTGPEARFAAAPQLRVIAPRDAFLD
ncbi:MAG TPA: hypothetical protein VHD82_01065 [Amycolatopsis sp.]|nr:hypothetical protein [Amycolatopsis sp.]